MVDCSMKTCCLPVGAAAYLYYVDFLVFRDGKLCQKSKTVSIFRLSKKFKTAVLMKLHTHKIFLPGVCPLENFLDTTLSGGFPLT